MAKFVLFYEAAEEQLSLIPQHFAAHRARWSEFQSRGTLLLIGPFADPRQGAMAVFTNRESAEEFAQGDPFVRHGIVKSWNIQEWNEAIGVN